MIKLVTDGVEWAVKHTIIFGWFPKYFDLKTPGYQWHVYDKHFPDCWGTRTEAEQLYRRISS